MQAPRLSLIVLTWNEEANIEACLRSIAAQQEPGCEVILIDAASSDRTVEIARRVIPNLGIPVELHVAPAKLPIGDARNQGVRLAQAAHVAFLSADAELEPGWIHQAVAALATHDLVFGAQLHAPHAWTLGASVRGLRYHFPENAVLDPLPYASNVAAAYSREVLLRFPFDPWANAAEDLLLAKRAVAAGYRATYNPQMRVRHHDVANARVEMRKNVREGRGCGLYVRELGVFVPWLAWAIALAGALVLLALLPGWATAALFAAALWAPAVRRGVRRRANMPRFALARAVAATPLFDLAFLANYLVGLPAARRPKTIPSLELTP